MFRSECHGQQEFASGTQKYQRTEMKNALKKDHLVIDTTWYNLTNPYRDNCQWLITNDGLPILPGLGLSFLFLALWQSSIRFYWNFEDLASRWDHQEAPGGIIPTHRDARRPKRTRRRAPLRSTNAAIFSGCVPKMPEKDPETRPDPSMSNMFEFQVLTQSEKMSRESSIWRSFWHVWHISVPWILRRKGW